MGIKDRVDAFGGRLKIVSTAGAGTTLRAEFSGVAAPGELCEQGGRPRATLRERSESVADEPEERAAGDSGGQIGTPVEQIDSVQEADEESFPASDAPSSWAGGG
jgi:hypothetical protein